MHLWSLILAGILLSSAGASRAEGGILAQVKGAGVLRVCADPDNLPFSSKDPREPGYDVEVAGEIARALGARAEMTWVSTFLGRSAIRQLLDGKCDLFMGLPHDERFLSDNPRLALSTPYYTLQHVLVSPTGQSVKDLSHLGDRKVAVEQMSLGDIFLFQNGHPRQIYRTQTEAFLAVVRGETPAAFLWAPIGWWLVKKDPAAKLQAAEVSIPGLEFRVGVGMRKGDEEFQTAVNDVVEQMVAQGKVGDILAHYGMPSRAMAQAVAGAKQGRSLYYQICAPCHGEDASGGGPVPSLKEFQGTEEKFLQIGLNGRADRGMPPWKGKLSEDELLAIRVFIQSLPK